MREQFYQLINAVKNSNSEFVNEDLDFIDRGMQAFARYVDAVYRHATLIPIYSVRYDGEEFRDKVQDLDFARRTAHEAAIASCSKLNRICNQYNVKPFCPQTVDRYEIADFCGQVSMEFYLEGIGKDTKNIDQVIEAMQQSNKTISFKSIVDKSGDFER